MTKRLSPEEKERRKQERKREKKKAKREIRKQQKAKSQTVKTIVQPKPKTDVNLCDECIYEFGECEGKPKFASDIDPTLKGVPGDRVIECDTFFSIDDVPPEEGRTGEPEESVNQYDVEAAAELAQSEAEEEALIAEEKEREKGNWPPAGSEEDEGELEAAPEPEIIKAEPIERAPLDRFEKDKTDYGACPSCTRDLKRTAYSRYLDAIRCVNPRCRSYRAIVKTVPSGAK